MRRFPKPAMEGLLQSQPGELFPGNKLPFPTKSELGVHASTVNQPRADGGAGVLASVTVFSKPDDPFGLGLTGGEFKVVSPEEAMKDAEHINMMGQIEQAMAVVAALEDLADAVAVHADAGLDDTALAVVDTASQQLLASVGSADVVVPALESFEKNRVAQSRLVLEGLRDRASEIWRKIVEALQKALIWLKVKIKMVLDRSRAMLHYINDIENRAKALHVLTPLQDSVPVSNLIWTLQINGQWPEHLLEDARTAQELVGARLRFGYEAGFRRRFGPSVWEQPNTEHILAALTGGSFKSNDPRLRLPHTKQVGDTIIRYSDELLGGKVIKEVSGTPEAVQADPVRFALSNPVLADYKSLEPGAKQHNDRADTQVPVLELRALSSILKSAFNLAAACEEYRGTLATVEVLAFEMTRAAKRMDPKDTSGAARIKKQVFAAAPRFLVHEPVRMADYALSVARALAVYSDRCVKKYEAREQRGGEA